MEVGEVADLVDEHRAALAARLLVGAEHEVVEEKLAAPLEEVDEARLAVRAVKYVANPALSVARCAAFLTAMNSTEVESRAFPDVSQNRFVQRSARGQSRSRPRALSRVEPLSQALAPRAPPRLRPFARTPELAVPDDDLLGLLRSLAGRTRTVVPVVSGRTRETRERWLGRLPIGRMPSTVSGRERGPFVGLGDDWTDEDLFAALSPESVAVHVGRRSSRVAIRLPAAAAARRFPRALIKPS